MTVRTLVSQLRQDAVYALRTMGANPLFASMAVLSLALGIGANTAIYSFLEAILMRSLPVQNPESLVVFNWHSKDFPAVAHSFNGSNYKDAKTGMNSGNLPYPFFELARADNSICSVIFGFAGAGRLNLQVRGQADFGTGQYVTGEYFRGLGIPPAAGRLLDEDDDRGRAAVLVLSYEYARKRYTDAPAAVGQTLLVNDHPFQVVGVTPPGFYGVDPGGAQDLYMPMHSGALLQSESKPDEKYSDANSYWIQMMGRLRPGVTLPRAQEAMAALFKPLIEGSASSAKERADLPALLMRPGATGLDTLSRRYSEPLYVLMTMVGLILAIACANIANLLLARATGRRREIAVRLSLGAARSRVIRQLLTESLLLALFGGALGLLLANWGIRLLTALIGNGRENFTMYATLNWNVLAVSIALSLATGVIFGLAPALQATRVDLVSALKQTRAGDPGLRLHRSWMRFNLSQILVAAQIAISLLLLVAAGLFVRTLTNLGAVQVGFNRENVLIFNVNAYQAGYRDQALARFYDGLLDRLRAIPGVRSATSSGYAMVSGSLGRSGVVVPGAPDSVEKVSAVLPVGSSFFHAMQIPILLGRDIDDRDQTSAARVAVVNEMFVQKFFGGANPLGRRIGVGRDTTPDIEIVGVCKAARLISLKDDIPTVIYAPYAQIMSNVRGMTYELRAAGNPLGLANSVRRAVQQADARLPVADLRTQSEVIEQTIGQERTFAMLCTGFAVLAVLIACVGLYGTMAYSVARRTNEIGVRMALGARRGLLVWMVLREVMALAAAGLAAGLPAAYLLAHVVESYLFGMKARDPFVLAAAAVALLLAAAAAGYGPARRASRIDPWVALRNE
jgi:macrolide transport system ATP-binding/permease protein